MSAVAQFAASDLLVTYTLFPDVMPTAKTERADVDWQELVERIRNAPSYPSKARCPLLSFAEYGDRRSDKGCIRHADNVQRIFGVEIDYDGEQISIESAAEMLQASNLCAVLYTSPSHTRTKPRWRALLPLSEPTFPEKRAEYVGRVNRILGGIASRESFTLSQSFYIGRVQGVEYGVLETNGRCIDMAADIEPMYFVGGANDGESVRDATTDDELRQSFMLGTGRYVAMLKLSSRWAARGMSQDDIEAALHGLLDQCPTASNADGIDLRTRVHPMAQSAARKFGETRSKENPIARSSAGMLDLRLTKNGVIPDEENVLRILMRDPNLQGVIKFDEFASEMIIARPISDDDVVAERGIPRPWTDADTVTLQTYIQRFIVPRMGREKIEAVVGMYARKHCAFHPVRNYLQSLEWDRVPRLDSWLREYLGAVEQPADYLAAVGARWLMSAVARILEPGCQADSAIVLEGSQGIFKSTALRTLSGDEYFSDSLPADVSHKDARDHLRGKWIVELSELAQFKRGEIETIKAFISRRYEQYRPSYGRHEIKFPRQCVFAGTTNADEYLVDMTGNRRFWVVACRGVELQSLARDRDQLWAEAVTRYRAGKPWFLSGELANVAAAEAQSRVTHDPWTGHVAKILEERLPPIVEIAPGEVLGLMDLGEGERHGRNASRVAQILRDLGWRKARRDRTRGQIYARGVKL